MNKKIALVAQGALDLKTYIETIPSMTGYNTPYGTVAAVSNSGEAFPFWMAFLGYSTVSMANYAFSGAGNAPPSGAIYYPPTPYPPGKYVFKAGTGFRADYLNMASSITIVGITMENVYEELYLFTGYARSQPQHMWSPPIRTKKIYKGIYFRANGIWSDMNTHLTMGNCQVYKADPAGTFKF